MTAFPDTSFLCAMYVSQDNSVLAAESFRALPEALTVSSLLLYEFRQSVRFQVWLYSRDKSRGYPPERAEVALSKLQLNLDAGAVVQAAVDWPDVHRRAEIISQRHTRAGGHRSLDIVHVATALHLGAQVFLSFDTNQRKLAAAEKLRAKP